MRVLNCLDHQLVYSDASQFDVAYHSAVLCCDLPAQVELTRSDVLTRSLQRLDFPQAVHWQGNCSTMFVVVFIASQKNTRAVFV